MDEIIKYLKMCFININFSVYYKFFLMLKLNRSYYGRGVINVVNNVWSMIY